MKLDCMGIRGSVLLLLDLLIIWTLCGLKIIFVLINPVPGLIDLHCVVQGPELMHIDILFL